MSNDEQHDVKPQTQTQEISAGEKLSGNPVRDLMVVAALYFPLGFFFWYVFASAFMKPASMLTQAVLTGFFPDLFERIVQLGFMFEVHTKIIMPQEVEGQKALLNLDINPLIYAWGLPLLFGLIMATPQRTRWRIVQLAISLVVVTLVASWGVFWEIWRDLAFMMGPEVGAVIHDAGLAPTPIALCYQLGFLMFPGVIPIAAWILMNRPFIEQLVESRQAEP